MLYHFYTNIANRQCRSAVCVHHISNVSCNADFVQGVCAYKHNSSAGFRWSKGEMYIGAT